MEETTAKRRNPYDKYHIDEAIKKAGIWFEDEDIRVRVTYAGKENSRYDKMHKMKLKPFDTQIKAENFSDDRYYPILAEVYAATVVLEFQVKLFKDDNDNDTEGTWVPGCYNKDGEIVDANEANITQAFVLGNRMFQDVIKVATNFNLYRQGQKEEDAKN
jgi:hypothetical protein